MFLALLAHPQEVLHKRYLVYYVCVMSVGCVMIAGNCYRDTTNLHYKHAIYQVTFV
jgi:hypothetical protein